MYWGYSGKMRELEQVVPWVLEFEVEQSVEQVVETWFGSQQVLFATLHFVLEE